MSDNDNDLFPEENEEVEKEDIETHDEQDQKFNYVLAEDDTEAAKTLHRSLVQFGFVNFDSNSADNSSSEAMVSAEHRKHFRRDVYVGIKDTEQNLDFLGRVVEGPFHSPHEVGSDSAITRTTVLHPDRTQFRPSYYVTGTIEILGQLSEDERLIPCPTRPRPYSEIYIFPPERLQRFLEINGNFYLGQLMGYEQIPVKTDVESKNFLPRNIGIFGTVGSGKSNTTQVIMEEAIQAGWAVVVVDVEGEYVRMNKPTSDVRLIPILSKKYGLEPLGINDLKVYVPQSGHSDAEKPVSFKVPISAIDPYVLSDLMDLSDAQARMFESMTAKAANTPRPSGSRQGSLAQSNSQPTTIRNFTLQHLIDGIEDNSLVPPKTSKDTIGVLHQKLIRLGRSQMLDWNATNSIPELPIDELLVGGRLSVLDVSETDDRSRNIAIAYTLQSLFDMVIQTPVNENMPNGKPRPKVLVVIEEVHTFVSRNNAVKMRSVLDNMQIISRRGRKRWMSLALVSQSLSYFLCKWKISSERNPFFSELNGELV